MTGLGSKEKKESGKPKHQDVSKYLLSISAFWVCLWVRWGEVALGQWARWTNPDIVQRGGQRSGSKSWNRYLNEIISDNGECQEDGKPGSLTIVGGIGTAFLGWHLRRGTQHLRASEGCPIGSGAVGQEAECGSDSRNQNGRTFSVAGRLIRSTSGRLVLKFLRKTKQTSLVLPMVLITLGCLPNIVVVIELTVRT